MAKRFDPADDTTGLMAKRLDAESTEVTIRRISGEEVMGHLRREGDGFVLETDQDIEEEGEVTLRMKDTGDEVKGHIRR